MNISVFIPTGNRAKSLDAVLDSLTKQTYKNFEVLVVDYRSHDDTPHILASYRKRLRIRTIHQKAKGLALAANLALNAARGSIFIRTDDDVVMSTGWLHAIYNSFARDKSVGGVTGPTVIPLQYKSNRDLFVFEDAFSYGNPFWRLIGKIYFKYFMEGNPRRISHWYDCGAFSLGTNFKESSSEPVQEVTNLEACNFAVKTSLLRRVDGFDTSYEGVGEYHEADAAFKIMQLGYKLVFNPKAYLNHMPSQDGFYKERPESFTRMKNFIIFYRRHIHANTLRKFVRFVSYIIFLNCYYAFTAVKMRQPKQLGALPGTIAGFINYGKV